MIKKLIRNSGLVAFYRKQEKIIFSIVLCLLIFLIWSWVYSRTSLSAWQTPLGYEHDSLYNLGVAKAFMDGDIFPVLSKWVAHLNAPFSANWNDFPMTEELIYAVMGWGGRLVGLFPAANFMVLLAHVLAGLSFWYVCRELKYRPSLAFACAIVFSFSNFSFYRNFAHINLTYYWHVPLMLLVTFWTYSSRLIKCKDRQWYIAIAVAAVSGTFNPYYIGMFLQFLGFAVLLHLARKQYYLLRFPLLLIGVTAASFLIMNADTLSYSFFHGVNHGAVVRDLASLEIYGLKIPDLFYPPSYHSWCSFANDVQRNYFLPSILKGEAASSYIGIIGLIGLACLAVTFLYHLLRGTPQFITVHAWQILWIFLYSLVGGLNLLLGSFGFVLFRGANRYSIFILAIILLFLVRQLSRKCPKKMVLPLAFGIAIIGLWDQLPPKFSEAQINQMADYVELDQRFAKQLESQLPKNSMVFQLPVADYPEEPPIHQMSDYAHFKPYLFTQHLHYSYGGIKGRGDTDWQHIINAAAPADMAAQLETYGFGALIINRKGYGDKGEYLIRNIVSTNRPVLLDNGDLVAIRLKASVAPILPEKQKAFAKKVRLNFFQQEITSTSPRLLTVKAAKTIFIPLKVKNISREAWSNTGIDGIDTYRVSLGFIWLNSYGNSIQEGRAILPMNLMPGSSVTLDVKTKAPSQPGNYKLHFSMIQEHVAWFNDNGALPLVINVKVE